MIGNIIFLVVAVCVVCAVIDDIKSKKDAVQKKAQEEQEKREFERQTVKQIQENASRVSESTFYKKLLSELKLQIQKDVRIYTPKAYNEYMKTPGAIPSKFKPNIFATVGHITVNACGVYYCRNTRYIYFTNLNFCEFQFNCSEHGYSNLNSIQVWALARVLCEDLGYEFSAYRDDFSIMADDTGFYSCADTPECAVKYLKWSAKFSNRSSNRDGIHVDLCPHSGTGYLTQLIDSEIQRLQNSGISYKSPF